MSDPARPLARVRSLLTGSRGSRAAAAPGGTSMQDLLVRAIAGVCLIYEAGQCRALATQVSLAPSWFVWTAAVPVLLGPLLPALGTVAGVRSWVSRRFKGADAGLLGARGYVLLVLWASLATLVVTVQVPEAFIVALDKHLLAVSFTPFPLLLLTALTSVREVITASVVVFTAEAVVRATHEAVAPVAMAVLFDASLTLLGGVVTFWLLAQMQRLEASLRQGAQEQARRAVLNGVRAARRRVGAVVHDQVLDALVLAQPDRHVPVVDVRAAAEQALAGLRREADAGSEGPASVEANRDTVVGAGAGTAGAAGGAGAAVVPVSELVRALSRRAERCEALSPWCRVTVRGEQSRRWWSRRPGIEALPVDVARTLELAAAEALRNVSRHAGGAARAPVRCLVRVRAGARGVSVRIADDGVGFSPRRIAGERLGVRGSIVGGLAALAGGSARIRSRPGAGTRVRLAWKDQGEAASTLVLSEHGLDRAMQSRAGLVFVGLGVVATWIQALCFRQAFTSAVAVMAAAALLTAAALAVCWPNGHPIGRVQGIIAVVTASVAPVLAMSTWVPQPMMGVDSGITGYGAAVACLLHYRNRAAHAVTTVVLQVAGVIAVHGARELPLWPAVSSGLYQLFFVSSLGIVAAIVRVTERRGSVAREGVLVARSERLAVASLVRSEAYLLGRVRERAGGLLEQLAVVDGEVPPALAEEARLLEAELRDMIRAPGIVREPAVVVAVRDARARGVTVSLLDDSHQARGKRAEGGGDGSEGVGSGGEGDRLLCGAESACVLYVLGRARAGETVTVRLHPPQSRTRLTVGRGVDGATSEICELPRA